MKEEVREVRSISLQDLQSIDESFYKRVADEWERVTSKGFGKPDLLIDLNRDEKTTLVTAILVFQHNTSIYSYFRSDKKPTISEVFLTSSEGVWIGERSKY